MSRRKLIRRHDERGASLVLAIVFMVVVGALGSGVVASITSGIKSGVTLAAARNREYAADFAIESEIARVRQLNVGVSSAISYPSCGTEPSPYTFEHNPQVTIHVDCANKAVVAGLSSGALALQNDVSFNACLAAAAPCTASNSIISALVNFQPNGATKVTTYVLSWSVNG